MWATKINNEFSREGTQRFLARDWSGEQFGGFNAEGGYGAFVPSHYYIETILLTAKTAVAGALSSKYSWEYFIRCVLAT